MDREPIGLYIFRFVMGLFLATFMGMLYWSSALIEEDLKTMQSSLGELKSDFAQMQVSIEKIKGDLLHFPIEHQRDDQRAPKIEKETNDSKEKSAFSNILKPDPFYEAVLPKLLGKNFLPLGVQHSATIGKPDNLHPFSAWSQVSSWQDLCSIAIAKLQTGKYETFAPDLALRMEERVNPATQLSEFWIFLRNDVYWEPLNPDLFPAGFQLAPQFLQKHAVTAEDIKFFFDAMMNPYVEMPGAVSLRTYYAGVEEVRVEDSHTLVVRWKSTLDPQNTPRIKYNAKQFTGALKPLPSFVFKYFANGKKIIEEDADQDTYRTNSVWAQNFSEHWAKNIIVSCGPWIFEGMTERQIRFKRNPHYYTPLEALTASIEIDFKESPDNIWAQFKNNRLDLFSLQPEQLSEYQKFLNSDAYQQQAKEHQGVSRLDYVARSYQYIGWNAAKPYFQSAKVRRALTMAIDRQRLIRTLLNGLGIETTGTFYRYSPAYDPSIAPLPYSPFLARRTLEEEGWSDTDGDGIIDKLVNGVRTPFRFTLIYYVKNPTTKAICEYVSTSLKEVGIDCRLNGVDIADLSAQFDDKSFDALSLAWSLGTPPEDPRQLWHSAGAKQKGSSNAVGFANAEIDSIIDQLDYEYDPKKRIQLYHRFDAILYEQQPYTFLYTPKVAMVYRDYLQNVFIPKDRQELIPGSNIGEPIPPLFWIKKK
jgi:peptide/nickel transport system substrate-binding protein